MPISKTFGERLYDQLSGNDAVSTLVGTNITPGAGAQNEQGNSIVYEVRGQDPSEWNGLNCVWVGAQTVDVTLHCFSTRAATAERIRHAVDDALSQGWFVTGEGDLEIRGAVPTGGLDVHEFQGGGSAAAVYRCTRDFSVTTARTFA